MGKLPVFNTNIGEIHREATLSGQNPSDLGCSNPFGCNQVTGGTLARWHAGTLARWKYSVYTSFNSDFECVSLKNVLCNYTVGFISTGLLLNHDYVVN